MLAAMLNNGFSEAFSFIHEMTVTHGYALSDILRTISVLVLAMQLPGAVLAKLLDDMSTIEWRLASGGNEKNQLAALVGSFMVAREMMTPP